MFSDFVPVMLMNMILGFLFVYVHAAEEDNATSAWLSLQPLYS